MALNGDKSISKNPPKSSVTKTTTPSITPTILVITPSNIICNPPSISPENIILIPSIISPIPSNTPVSAVKIPLIGAINISNRPLNIPSIVRPTATIGVTRTSVRTPKIPRSADRNGSNAASISSASASNPKNFNTNVVRFLRRRRGKPTNQSKTSISPSLTPPKKPPSPNLSMKPLMNATKPNRAEAPIAIGTASGASAAPNARSDAFSARNIAGRAIIVVANPPIFDIRLPKKPFFSPSPSSAESLRKPKLPAILLNIFS